LRWDDVAVLSSSPELFLGLQDGMVTTCPIKGTRPRGTDQASDNAARAELTSSAKDQAELAMIVDLLRNDLGRVCEYGSVAVLDAGRIEAHPTVFHRVATIVGQLRSGQTWIDLLRATIPGGSITGAPKIRAMQIIAELESTQRSVYCGSIGMIGLDGSLQLSVAIRTMIQVGNVVHVFAGGAIVADSDPQDEYREILAKAAGMLQALGCGEPATEPRIMELSRI
jgi:para-aminobenzoate synthetase component 1